MVPEPEPEPVVNDHALQQPDSNGDHVLTSEHGQDVVMAGGSSTDAAGQAASSLSETEPDEEPAEPARRLCRCQRQQYRSRRGRIQYPKNAINEGLAGTVKVGLCPQRVYQRKPD